MSGEVAIILDCLDPPCDPFRGLDIDPLDLTMAIGIKVQRNKWRQGGEISPGAHGPAGRRRG